MEHELKKEELLSAVAEIAFGKTNDIVRLAFLDPDESELYIDNLDLRLLSEVKRSGTGAIEIKLMNRLDAMRLLLAELDSESGKKGTESFLRAMEKAAEAEDESA